MKVLFITSSTARSGKTTIAAVLGKYFIDRGKKPGYFKPALSVNTPYSSRDAALMKRYLKLDETEEMISPAFNSETELKTKVMLNLARVGAGKDVLIIEGTGNPRWDMVPTEIPGIKIIGVEAHAGDYTNVPGYYRSPGKGLAGIIINKVPAGRREKAAEIFTKTTGINALGTVPEERCLASLTVRELAQKLGGEIFSGEKEADTIIENIMLGALVPDHATDYFKRKENKAVILRSERSDMQLAALETPTRCLVLAGKKPPITVVAQKAEDKHVPVIMAELTVPAIIQVIEKVFSDTSLSLEKLEMAAEAVLKHIDMVGLERAAGAV